MKEKIYNIIKELISIIIGILIALQIDNWNEQQKDKQKETYYLSSLNTDLKKNYKEIERVIAICNKTIENTDSLLQISEKEIHKINLKRTTQKILEAGSYAIFNNKSSTFRELITTGDLKLITNDSLRLYIANWESEIEELRSYELANTNNAHKYTDYVMEQIDVYKHQLNRGTIKASMLSALFKDKKFMNNLTGRTSYPKWLKQEYVLQQQKTKILLQLIKKEAK